MKLLKSIFLTLLAVVLITCGTAPKSHAETPGVASFSVSGGTYQQNSTVSLPIYETSSVPVNAICIGVNYDQTKLKFLSVSQAATTQYDLPSRECGGAINITRVAMPFGTSWSGKNLFATVSFKVLSAQGSADINFSSMSMVIPSANVDPENPNIWDRNTTGATLNLTAASAVQTPQATAKSTQTQPSKTSSSVPVTTPTQLKQATLGAETTKSAAIQSAPTTQSENPKNTEQIATLNFDASHTSGNTYLTAAYLFAVTLLAGSLLVVKRRYKLSKQAS